jgi:hypothetical protein
MRLLGGKRTWRGHRVSAAISDKTAFDAKWGAHNELLLAFWSSIGFKPGDFMTVGMNEKRTALFCRV